MLEVAGSYAYCTFTISSHSQILLCWNGPNGKQLQNNNFIRHPSIKIDKIIVGKQGWHFIKKIQAHSFICEIHDTVIDISRVTSASGNNGGQKINDIATSTLAR